MILLIRKINDIVNKENADVTLTELENIGGIGLSGTESTWKYLAVDGIENIMIREFTSFYTYNFHQHFICFF